MTLKLCSSSLAELPTIVSRPSYDRSKLSAGIIHIGVGNFHRAHQARYLDALFDLGHDHDWAIIGAGIMPYDAMKRKNLEPQDWLSTVVEMGPDSLKAKVTGSMIGFCDTDAKAIINQIADPAIRIITLTITEGGYFINAATKRFDENHPDIIHDALDIEQPSTVFGIILAGLKRRRELGHPAPTILSCDNIPRNGTTTRKAVEGLARLISSDLADWVNVHVAFPNSIVDRITPGTTEQTRSMIRKEFGIDDAEPVICEPFTQWVMEDNFTLGRPQFERVGVEFVSDISAYETMKLRILNASHAAMAYPSALLGYTFVDEALNDDSILKWLKALMTREVIPTLKPIPGVDYLAYLDKCIARFKNPNVRDTIARLCQDGSNRQPKFILSTVEAALRAEKPIGGLALEIAFWCRYCAQTDPLDDQRSEALSKAAKGSAHDPASFLQLTEIFGPLANNKMFVDSFAHHIDGIWTRGPSTALRQYLNEAGG